MKHSNRQKQRKKPLVKKLKRRREKLIRKSRALSLLLYLTLERKQLMQTRKLNLLKILQALKLPNQMQFSVRNRLSLTE